MASSGDYDWTSSTYQIITGAMRLISAIQSGEAPPAEEWEDALASLNGLIHALQASGLHVWTQTTFTVPLVAGQSVYQIGIGAPDVGTSPRPLKITGGRLMLGDQEVPLIPMSRWDLANLSNKANPQAAPSQYFYDPQLPYGILTVYPTPAAAGTARFVGQRPLQSFDTQRDTADLPQEWISALRFALAVELAPEYDVPAERLKILKDLADEKLATVKGWDVEPAGTTTLPFTQPVYQLIAGALRLCGGSGPQDTPTLGLINNGFYSLNAMVQEWQARQIHLWTECDATLFLQPGQRVYRIGQGTTDHCCRSDNWVQSWLAVSAPAGTVSITLASSVTITVGMQIGILSDPLPQYLWTTVAAVAGTTVTLAAPLPRSASGGNRVIAYTQDLIRPLKVPSARRMTYAGNGGVPARIETTLTVYARIDYAAQTNKDALGEVNAYFYDPQLGQGVLSTWVTTTNPNSAMMFTAQLPLTTFADLHTNDNFPVEWSTALRYCLAVELWPEHAERRAAVLKNPMAGFQELKLLADDKLLVAQAWDREPQSIYFGLQGYPSWRDT